MNSKNIQIQSVNIMEFSSENIEGNQVGTFIMHLYKNENFSHIGYHKQNERWIIHTRLDNKKVIKYFKKSSPEVIRKQCQQTSFEPHCIILYANGYKEVSEFEA